MNSIIKIFVSYTIALIITLILALIDSDPIKSKIAVVVDIFFMSILIWGVGLFIYGIKRVLKKRNGYLRNDCSSLLHKQERNIKK
jgi:hypothetical protein